MFKSRKNERADAIASTVGLIIVIIAMFFGTIILLQNAAHAKLEAVSSKFEAQMRMTETLSSECELSEAIFEPGTKLDDADLKSGVSFVAYDEGSLQDLKIKLVGVNLVVTSKETEVCSTNSALQEFQG